MSYVKSNVPYMAPDYWMVHGAGPTNVKHPTEERAFQEAARLASLNPGTEFFVLKTTALAKTVSPVLIYTKD